MESLNFGPVAVYLGEKSGKYPDGNQVIVRGRELRVAFDTPLVANRHPAILDGVDAVLLGHVHEDHTVALGRLRAATVEVHEADLAAAQSWEGLSRHYGYSSDALEAVRKMIERDYAWQPRPDATGFRDGSSWDLGGVVRIRAHHLPGHTAGHCALVVESEGVAFISDIDLTGFGPYYGDATSDLDQFERSLARVREIDAKIWVTSHHRGVVTDRQEFLRALDAFASRIEQRSARLLEYLRGGPQTLAQLVARRLLYPVGFELPYVECAERRSIELHLQQLQSRGQVAPVGDGRYALA